MPKNEKISVPIASKMRSVAPAARLALIAVLRRAAPAASAVMPTKIGAAEIGLMTENSDVNARKPKLRDHRHHSIPPGSAGNGIDVSSLEDERTNVVLTFSIDGMRVSFSSTKRS